MSAPLRDVLVVGGGPAGAAVSILLRRRGHDVVLVDEARFPRDKVCGEGIARRRGGCWASWMRGGRAGPGAPPASRHGSRLPDGTAFRGLYRRGDSDMGFAVRRDRFDPCCWTGRAALASRCAGDPRPIDRVAPGASGVAIENGAGPGASPPAS